MAEHRKKAYGGKENEQSEQKSEYQQKSKQQSEPKYAEMCRRFLADEKDFSLENLALAGITTQFENLDSDDTTQAVIAYIKQHLA